MNTGERDLQVELRIVEVRTNPVLAIVVCATTSNFNTGAGLDPEAMRFIAGKGAVLHQVGGAGQTTLHCEAVPLERTDGVGKSAVVELCIAALGLSLIHI